MLVRFRLPDSEVNLVASNVASFVPAGEDSTTITMLNGQEHTVPFSPRAVRSALKKAFAPAEATSTED